MEPEQPMLPRLFRVSERVRESADVVSLTLEPADAGPPVRMAPGQFNMIYAFGIGESPISLSGDPASDRLEHTIRAAGPVTRALCKLDAGEVVGLRGPFGSAWPLDQMVGVDVILVGGGIGVAPLRPVIYELLRRPDSFHRLSVLYGARTPDDLIFERQLRELGQSDDVDALITVDAAGEHWTGAVGVVPALIAKARFDPASAIALVCGPEVMIRFAHQALKHAGLPEDRMHVSLERNMACAIGLCGHCQLGPEFICMDGPVFAYPRVSELLSIPEL